MLKTFRTKNEVDLHISRRIHFKLVELENSEFESRQTNNIICIFGFFGLYRLWFLMEKNFHSDNLIEMNSLMEQVKPIVMMHYEFR